MAKAWSASGQAEAAIRADERAKWVGRLRENADLFAQFATDKKAAVLLAALLMDVNVGGDEGLSVEREKVAG